MQNDRMIFQIGRSFENAERDADGNLTGGIFDMNIFRRTSGWRKDFEARSALEADSESDWAAWQWFR